MTQWGNTPTYIHGALPGSHVPSQKPHKCVIIIPHTVTVLYRWKLWRDSL